MWANHNVAHTIGMYTVTRTTTRVCGTGVVDWANFKIIVERVIRQYFHKPNYYKIDNCPGIFHIWFS